MVISWSIGTQPDAGLVNTMLDAAIETLTNGEERPIVHSDRGALIAGPAGSHGSAKQNWFARCLERAAHNTTQRAKAPSAG